jgi:peptidoglycan/LPS O-acetylase OafA/YrhL
MQKVFSFSHFSREETNFLKGIAIILIALHNYYRWISPMNGENEFEFSRLYALNSYIIIRSDPFELLHVFFSFLGHYGVQAFIVISAYGLTRSFRNRQPGYGRYLLHRINKLYPAIWFAAIAFILFNILTTGRMIGIDLLHNIIIQLTLFANLIPGKAMVVSGPWWFWSFIFGFYLVFPVIYRFYRKTGTKGLLGLVIVGYLFTILAYSSLRAYNLNPYMMFAGHLPEFCLGIFLADRKELHFPWWIILVSMLIVAGGNWFAWLWPFANLGVSVLLVAFIGWLLRVSNRANLIFRAITFIGTVSLYIFALQGFVRNPFLGLSGNYNSSLVSLFSGLLFLAVVTGLAWMMMRIEKTARTWIAGAPSSPGRVLRFILLFLSVTVPFTALVLAGNTGHKAGNRVRDTSVFTAIHDFEKEDPKYPGRYSDSVFLRGHGSCVLPFPDSYSPSISVDLGKVAMDGVYRAESSAMIFTTDPEATCHLVFEVWNISTDQRVDWQQEWIPDDKFPKGKWTLCIYNYIIPKEYLHSAFKLKTYLWNPGKGKFYADDLKLEVIAGK